MIETPLALDQQARALIWHDTAADCAVALQILADPSCSLATAAYLFWAVQPQEHRARDLLAAADATDAASPLAVISCAVHGVRSGRFAATLAYDPTREWDITERVILPRRLQATLGEIPVLSRDAAEIAALWALEDEIQSAPTAESLFAIATHLAEPEAIATVLASPVLDQGTALLLYWRLLDAVTLWTQAEPLLRRVELLLDDGQLPAVLAYDPRTDPANDSLLERPRWDIPREFTRASGAQP